MRSPLPSVCLSGWLSLFLLLTLSPAWAACPSRTYTYTTGGTIDSGQVTTNEDNLYTYACAVDTFAAGSVNAAAIGDDAVGSAEIAAGAVGASELASGAVDAGDMATTGTIADDKVFVADSATAATWRTITNCTDTGGNHLNYTESTNAFSCGTSGDGTATAATQAEMETATSTSVFVTPGRVQYHPGIAKVWANFTPTATITASYNVTSITDTGVGDWRVNMTTAMSTATANTLAMSRGAAALYMHMSDQGAGQVMVQARDAAGTLAESDGAMVAVFGDQ